MTSETDKVTRIIACMVFKTALEELKLLKRFPNVAVTYLPARLHLQPNELRERLLKEIASAQRKGERIICLYGECFPGISEVCERHGVPKITGHYCYEMLLGHERFRQLVEEAAGTYFLERDLIQNFEQYCMIPLELQDEEMRAACFEHYQRLLYVRQPSDPDLTLEAGAVAHFLELTLHIEDADYSHLEQELINLISIREHREDEKNTEPEV